MTNLTNAIGSRKNLLKNSVGIFFSRVITTLVAFISIPIIVEKLGIDGFGTWESIVAVSVLANIFQGSISGTLLWLVSNAYGVGDTESIRDYVRMSVCVSIILFLTITPATWLGRFFLVELFRVPVSFVHTATWILPCVVGLMLLGCICEILGALIGGYQQAGATTLTQAVAATVNNVLVIICLVLGLGFWSLLIGFGAGFLISVAGLYLIARRTVGSFSLSPKFPSRTVMVKVLPYAGFMLLGALSIGLRDQTDKIILSAVASPSWTGLYGIAARLASLVVIICTFFYVPTIAAAGALYSNNDHEGICRLYDDVVTMMSFLVGIVVILIAGLYDRLIILWIAKPLPEIGELLYLLLIGNAVAVILTGAASSVCKGMGIVRIETVYIVISIILNIILKLTLVPLFGAIGTLASTAVSWSISSVIFVYLLHKHTDIPFSSSKKAFKTLLIIVVCVCIARYLAFILPVEPGRLNVLPSLFILSAILSLIFTLLMIWSQVLPQKALMKYGHFILEKINVRIVKV